MPLCIILWNVIVLTYKDICYFSMMLQLILLDRNDHKVVFVKVHNIEE